MRHWSQLATRNWRAKKLRTFGSILAVALGTAAVVWVACCHESVKQSVLGWAGGYVGKAHITISSMWGTYDQIPQRIIRKLEKLDNVAAITPRLLLLRSCRPMRAETLRVADLTAMRWSDRDPVVDLAGIDVPREFELREYPLADGRRLKADDEFACMLEAGWARELGLKVGDYLLVWDISSDQPHPFRIVGLFERRRVARFQKPLALVPLKTLQRVAKKYALVSTVDLTLADAGREEMLKTALRVRALVRTVATNARVRSAEARLKQVEMAQNNQRFVLVLLGCVAMLTALFIILSTLSMGLLERVRQLGLLRCVGMTRGQLVGLVMLEVVPLGLVGVALGVPLGIALTALTVWLVPQYVGSLIVSGSGIAQAVAAGTLTTLVAASLPAISVSAISPLEASRPRARRPHAGWLVLSLLLGVGVLAWQHFGLIERTQRDVDFLAMAAAGVVALYAGYALLAGPLVRLVGTPAVALAALTLRVRYRLLQDQVGNAVWRAAGICCGLMVGLSLIVALVVVNRSVTSGWEFPAQFPAAFVWTFEKLPADVEQKLATTPGIARFTLANSINVIVEERRIDERILRAYTWFMGIDPDTFFDMVKAEFLDGQGDERSAREKLKRGGYVIVADDFARSRNKYLGDKVKVWDDHTGRWRYFTIAGVVRSPALDIAAGYFQMLEQYSVAASGSVIGSLRDAREKFGAHGYNLALLDFDLPDEPPPPDWPPPRDTPAGRTLDKKYYDQSVPLERRWRRYREQQVLISLRERLRDPAIKIGSVADLKDEIDTQITSMMTLLTAIPGVALVVAAIGVANLMTANVSARAKQIAILRAVGATRGLVMRMIIGEALVLGALGSALGLALGIHLADNITILVQRMWGLRVSLDLPWSYIGWSILLTVGLCVLAGLLPARHAARTNVVDALHVA